MIIIIPSILTNDVNEAKALLSRCEGVVDRVSIDIIDGKFADNRTITPDLLEEIETNLKMDYQLMVVEPVRWVERCVRGQARLRSATSARRANVIIGHIEHMSDQEDFVDKVREVDARVGLGVDLGTPVSSIDIEILRNLDVVLLMSVPAGFGGQEFRGEVIKKIGQLSEIREKDKTSFRIHVDGGVTFDNIKDIATAGADEVSVGRFLFKGDLKKNVEKFMELVERL
jgi:ribulose-phosphate 3-epimerase